MSSGNDTTARILAGGLFSEQALAVRYGKTVRTLQRWRAEGYGPSYLRIGGSIFYRMEDIEAFEAGRRNTGGGV